MIGGHQHRLRKGNKKMYESAKHKDYLLAVAQACYEHEDMIWQEDWFEVWDSHLAPLFREVKVGSFPTPDANEHYKQVYELGMAAGDCWSQEDWYEFCENVFALALDIASDEGWDGELVENFAFAYQALQ